MATRFSETFDAGGAYDLTATFKLMTMGTGDPCWQYDGPNRCRFTIITPAGPAGATVACEGNQLQVETHGVAAEWLLPHMPALLGVGFVPPEFDSPVRLVRIAQQLAGMRLPKLPAISARLVQIILQQLVSFRDACAGWRQLVRRYGTPSPDLPKLWYPPEPDVLKRLVSSQFIECGILPQHGRRIVETMRRATRLEEAWDAGDGADAADRLCNVLKLLPGIGPWTIGFLRGSSLGDVDAELVGDYSHPKHVAHFFGKPIAGADDEQMLKLLEPYRPHRFYALCLIILGSPAPPRRGPRRRSIRDRLR